jgi:hypothetical protein
MGRRTRRPAGDGAPVLNRARRAARRAARETDEELARIAENVYAVGRDVKATGGVGIPLAVYAPFRAAMELWTIVVVKRFNLAEAAGVTEGRVRVDLADYFTAWLIEMGTEFRVDAFLDWRERMLGLERRGTDGSSDEEAAHEGASAGE